MRRAQGGDEVLITVAGRPSARLVPVAPRARRRWSEVADLFTGDADATWERDRHRLDDALRDPWTPA